MGVPLANVQALRAHRPKQVRHAPSREDTLRLLRAVQAEAGSAVSLAVRLLYGCGLRVAEPASQSCQPTPLRRSPSRRHHRPPLRHRWRHRPAPTRRRWKSGRPKRA